MLSQTFSYRVGVALLRDHCRDRLLGIVMYQIMAHVRADNLIITAELHLIG